MKSTTGTVAVFSGSFRRLTRKVTSSRIPAVRVREQRDRLGGLVVQHMGKTNGSGSTSDPSGALAAHVSGATPPQVFRRITVCGQYRDEHQVPSLRLAGKWLRKAGFDLGQKVQVKVDDRRLTICAE